LAGAAIAYLATGSLGAAAITASVAVTFGPAKLIVGVAVRPIAFYVGPSIFDNTVAGWIFGKLVSDVACYVLAIFSYERFKGLLVRAS